MLIKNDQLKHFSSTPFSSLTISIFAIIKQVIEHRGVNLLVIIVPSFFQNRVFNSLYSLNCFSLMNTVN